MRKMKLTLLIMPSEGSIRQWSVAEQKAYPQGSGCPGILPWKHEELSPCCQISLGRKTNLPEQIHELAQSNGKLGAIRRGLKIRVISEGRVWNPKKATPSVSTDKFGQPLTYMHAGELIGLLPALKIYGNTTPVILLWRKLRK